MRTGNGVRGVLIGGLPLAFLAGVALGGGRAADAVAPPQDALSGPVAGYTTHVVATHFLREHRYETHHYFKPLREGVLQGLVFREAADGAPLIEVEWAIGQEIWERLPAWQQAFWHPLRPAVEAGRVSLPDLSAEEEREMLQTVAGLYAQTFNLAGLEDELPVGLEGLAMVTHLTPEEMRQLMGMAAGR